MEWTIQDLGAAGELVAEEGPAFLGDQLHQVELQLDRIGMPRQSHQPRQPNHVRIGNDARYAEGIAEDYIGGFTPHSRQTDQLLHTAGDLSLVLFGDIPAGRLDALGLVAKKAGTSYIFFQLAGLHRQRLPPVFLIIGINRQFSEKQIDLDEQIPGKDQSGQAVRQMGDP